MKIDNIVDILDEEFDVKNINDDWSFMFDKLFIEKSIPSFRKKGNNTGLLIKNSDEVNKIYTAFAPSRYVLEAIRMKGIVNTLLVVKHPFDWNGSRKGEGFIHFKDRDYQLMEGSGISVYSLHTPLDKNRNDKVVSTAYGFAKAIKFRFENEFGTESSNPNIKIGLIGKVPETKLNDLIKRLDKTLDYKPKVMKVSDKVLRVAIATGGAFNPEIIQQAKDLGADTYITGIITPNSSEYDKINYKPKFNEIRKIGINIIGCSHYLTEKWAMLYSIPYFSEILKSEFVEDREALNLLE